jgi:hypothetical protein
VLVVWHTEDEKLGRNFNGGEQQLDLFLDLDKCCESSRSMKEVDSKDSKC